MQILDVFWKVAPRPLNVVLCPELEGLEGEKINFQNYPQFPSISLI